MALLTLEQGAARLGTSLQTLEDWVRRGLLVVRSEAVPSESTVEAPRLVEEEDLMQLAESLGWLEISTNSWDKSEE